MIPAEPRRPGSTPPPSSAGMWAGASMGWTMAVELLTATLVWGGIGWLGDQWLQTAPWLMASGFIVGNFSGVYLCWLKMNRMDQVESAKAADALQGPARPAPEAEPRCP